ncbi:MAG: prepilin peptidase [Ignavibacteriales bacterium]
MLIYFTICFFVFGMILGSFFNVVGDRLSNGESIVSPSSHCPHCKHKLTPIELVPIFSYLLQGGKCKNCKKKIPIIHPIFEFGCGIVFALTYLSFGMSLELLIALTFISMLLIIIVSDINYMIIPDEVLIVTGILLFIEIACTYGLEALGLAILNGLISFTVMFLIKQFGDFLFKKESMGGGDIKLLFFFGLIFGWEMAIVSIFIGSIIGLPISLLMLYKNSSHIVPFGPFLSIGAIIVLLLQIDFQVIINVL